MILNQNIYEKLWSNRAVSFKIKKDLEIIVSTSQGYDYSDKNDVIFICSDGLSDNLTSLEIVKIMKDKI